MANDPILQEAVQVAKEAESVNKNIKKTQENLEKEEKEEKDADKEGEESLITVEEGLIKGPLKPLKTIIENYKEKFANGFTNISKIQKYQVKNIENEIMDLKNIKRNLDELKKKVKKSKTKTFIHYLKKINLQLQNILTSWLVITWIKNADELLVRGLISQFYNMIENMSSDDEKLMVDATKIALQIEETASMLPKRLEKSPKRIKEQTDRIERILEKRMQKVVKRLTNHFIKVVKLESRTGWLEDTKEKFRQALTFK